jgi:hypothetical protein
LSVEEQGPSKRLHQLKAQGARLDFLC